MVCVRAYRQVVVGGWAGRREGARAGGGSNEGRWLSYLRDHFEFLCRLFRVVRVSVGVPTAQRDFEMDEPWVRQ